jgi:hypothetical protein
MKASPRTLFAQHKANAKTRGIGFELTFEQWMEWWGEDLPKRGRGPLDLQMCRKGDAGPYALGNIYKGTARENHRTAGNMRTARAAARKKAAHEAALDALMWAESAPPKDEPYSKDEMDLLRATGAITDRRLNSAFAADKRR